MNALDNNNKISSVTKKIEGTQFIASRVRTKQNKTKQNKRGENRREEKRREEV